MSDGSANDTALALEAKMIVVDAGPATECDAMEQEGRKEDPMVEVA